MEAAPRVPPGFWPFADKSDIRPAERSAESSPDFVGHETRSIRRFSSAVEQRFCKPKVGSSILSTGTTVITAFTALLARFCHRQTRQERRGTAVLSAPKSGPFVRGSFMASARHRSRLLHAPPS